MVISLLLIALPLVSALDFSFSSPEEINAEEEFTILISASLEGNYDVKAFVHAHTKQYSEIFYGETWKSPFNYISSAFPSQAEFKLKSHYIGETKVCVRLRQTGTSSFEEKCNPIKILSANASQENSEEEVQEKAEPEETIVPAVESVVDTNSNTQKNPIVKQEKIVLNAPSSVEVIPLNVSKEKTHQWTKYALLSLLLLVIIFLILRKL